jgi:hypothetical protein
MVQDRESEIKIEHRAAPIIRVGGRQSHFINSMQRKFEDGFDQPPRGIAQQIVAVLLALLESGVSGREPNARRSERRSARAAS